jgi:hypothetical protein
MWCDGIHKVKGDTMTSEQVAKIIERVFVCFPSFRAWFDELGSRNQTYGEWTKALSYADYVDCLAVIDDWTSGRARPPAGFERDQTIYKLSKEAKDRAAERDRRAEGERIRARVDRASYQPLRFDASMSAAYAKILSRLGEYKAGQMDWPQWQQWCKTCSEEMK